MSRIKHPGQKKRLSLSRDHRVHARHDKNFRSEWPLKKARTNRKFRHAGKAALAAGVADEASDVPLDNAHVPLKRQRLLGKRTFSRLPIGSPTGGNTGNGAIRKTRTMKGACGSCPMGERQSLWCESSGRRCVPSPTTVKRIGAISAPV